MSHEVDELLLYFGDDYKINKHIVIHQPTIGEIITFGEKRFLLAIQMLTSTPSDLISVLADAGVDWESVSEFELFSIMISKRLKFDDTRIVLGNLDLGTFSLHMNTDSGQSYLKNGDCIIDQHIYELMMDVMRKMYGLKKTTRKAGNKGTKEAMIELDRFDRAEAANKPFKSQLKNLVSAMVNCAEFKYGINEVRDMPYAAFMDSVSRILAIKQSDALILGSVCGMSDLSKVPRSQWNFLRSLDD